MATKKISPKKSVPAAKKAPAKKSAPTKKTTVPVKKTTVPVKKKVAPPAKAPAKKNVPAKKTNAPAKTPSVPATKKTPAKKTIPAKTNVPVAKKTSAKKSGTKKTVAKKTPKTSKTPKENEKKPIGIFVPRDATPATSKISISRKSVAYSPIELEQLLFQRGVTNINIFDPNIAVSVPAKKQTETKKVILTKLPKAKEKRTIGAVSMADLFGFDPFAKNSVSEEEKLIPEKWRKYYKQLMERKKELSDTIARHSENAFRKESKEDTGDVSAYSQHTADIDNESFDRDFAICRLAAEQEELAEIGVAVERMKKGTYGICEITGKPIPAERLRRVPFTRYSLEGKLEAEKQRGIENRRRRANATGDLSDIIDIDNDVPVSLPEEHDEP